MSKVLVQETGYSHVTYDSVIQKVAALSNRSMSINESPDKFAMTSWKKGEAEKVVKDWWAKVDQKTLKARLGNEFQLCMDQFSQELSKESFAKALDKYVAWVKGCKSTQRPMALMPLLQLWHAGHILFPKNTKGLLPSGALMNQSAHFHSQVYVQKLVGLSRKGGASPNATKLNESNVVQVLMDAMVSISPVKSAGDLDPKAFQFGKGMNVKIGKRLIGAVILLQRDEYGAVAKFKAEDFGFVKTHRRANRDDKAFLWVLDIDPQMEKWRAEAEVYISSLNKKLLYAISSMNLWLDYLISKPDLSKNPVEFLDRKNQVGYPDFGKMGEISNDPKRPIDIHDMLKGVLERHCSAPDDFGNSQILPNFKNPVIRPIRKGANAIETHREPMPTRFISLCLEILTQDDYKWSKENFAADVVNWKNPETGKYEEIWSPIRTWLVILKLLLPARTIQLRMLDSGEADTECYRPEQGGWVANSGPHKPPKGKGVVKKGVFRKYQRKDGTTGSLVYFNTNKTADIDQDVDKRGYVMPWEHEEALKYFVEIRNWQEKYNPISQLTSWADVPEIKQSRSDEQLKAIGDSAFLFRDASNSEDRASPIKDARIRFCWLRLLTELERRLAASGDALPDGKPHNLILKRTPEGAPTAGLFDLHTLRVTIISALYEQGVKPEVIMKIVGHASVLMTLYYTKISPPSHHGRSGCGDGEASAKRAVQLDRLFAEEKP